MAELVKIRVPVDVVTLEVNDNGDTIVLPVSDERFIKRLYDFSDKVEKESEKLKFIDQNDIAAVVKGDIELHEMIKVEFTNLFGEGSYEKVFGEDIIVGAEYVLDFISQCTPYIKTHMESRKTKLNKYNADRVGSSL